MVMLVVMANVILVVMMIVAYCSDPDDGQHMGCMGWVGADATS